MSDLLQEIKDYLYSIRHNTANAALARNAKEYEVCIKTVFDCEEAVLSLFRKLDREYWELREQFEQMQAKVERYKEIINLFKMAFTTGDAEHRTINGRSVQAMALLEELEGE
jgi:hypothetical protein